MSFQVCSAVNYNNFDNGIVWLDLDRFTSTLIGGMVGAKFYWCYIYCRIYCSSCLVGVVFS